MMSVLPELASQQGRKDEKPNKELGNRLAETRDLKGIKEIAKNLTNQDRNIQIDCLAVLEQIGLHAPDLIEDYLDDFLGLAYGDDNRLIWSAMINIALIADRRPDQIYSHLEDLIEVIERGSVITQDNGIKILSKICAAKPEYLDIVFPYLIEQLQNCRAKSVPQYAESTWVAVNPEYQDKYLEVLQSRLDELSESQSKRVNKVIKSFG